MIHLCDNLYLRADQRNYILAEWDNDYRNDGSPNFTNERFYSTTKGLLAGLHNRILREGISSKDEQSMLELRESLCRADEAIARVASALDGKSDLRGLQDDGSVYKIVKG